LLDQLVLLLLAEWLRAFHLPTNVVAIGTNPAGVIEGWRERQFFRADVIRHCDHLRQVQPIHRQSTPVRGESHPEAIVVGIGRADGGDIKICGRLRSQENCNGQAGRNSPEAHIFMTGICAECAAKKERAGATGEKLRRPLLKRGDGFTALSFESAAFPRKRDGKQWRGYC